MQEFPSIFNWRRALVPISIEAYDFGLLYSRWVLRVCGVRIATWETRLGSTK